MTLPIVIALAGAAVLLSPPLVRLLDRKAGWPLAALFLAAAAVLSMELPDVLAGRAQTWSFVWVRDFLAAGVDVDFALKADALGVFFALLALLIGAMVFIYSAAYLPKHQGNTSFYTIMTAFTLAILVLVLADDVLVLFIGWELVSIASFLLIARSGSAGESGSVRTLVLTFIGGLTLLAALALAATQTGSTSLSEILASPVWAQDAGLSAVVAVLIAISAFTKSAQLPFHFWLPEAMAAATPVSAFLHAAAVVKAGIYLLLRFSTIFHDVTVWNWLLIVVGISTAVVSALFAVQKTDLKKLTAYSTVSHLGWIVATIGVGTPFALAAALVHTLAHALFKSSLFMLIGVIDHQTGTRDIRRLGVIWKKMPWTFASVLIGALSMAAVPPMLGFISKEGMLTAFQEAPIGEGPTWVLLLLGGLGALLTFTYSAKIVFGAFTDGPAEGQQPSERVVREAPVSLWLPAALPGLLSLPLGLAVGIFNEPIDAVVTAIGGEAETELALWHGFTLPLGISLAAIILGIIGVIYRHRIWPALESRRLLPFNGNAALHALTEGSGKLGRIFAGMADSLSPSRHLVWPVIMVITLMLFTLFGTEGIDGIPLAPRAEGLDNWLDLAPFLIILGSVSILVLSRNRVTGAVLIGAVGVGVSLQMLLLGAPDVALTQFLVEALVVVIMMMVIRHQPQYFPKVSRTRTIRSLIIAALAAVTAFLAVFTLLGRHERSELAEWFLANGPEITGGQNIVATIIVEFRALDTLGELSVLGMAAIVIGAVVSSFPRMQFSRGTHPRPFGQSQLNSLPLKKAYALAAPVLGVLSFLIFMRGHTDPGGGFVAALVAGTAIMMAYLAKGRDSIVGKPSTPYWLTGIGIIVALAAGFMGYLEGSFLKPIYADFLGQHWTTSLVFDGGIYLAVLGMLTAAINSMGGYLRPGAASVAELDYARSSGPLPDTPTPAPPAEIITEPYPEPLEPNPDPRDDGPSRSVGTTAVREQRDVEAGVDKQKENDR
ncbi:Na(+)/H(+) antiporter subunit A [Corynebacterium occultum]|uniref:Na(+)/H(+) antiporter subunit A n=1 Tax=Corynebacterium occultum TaxID=2675219 RepID=A0A6B8W199_9CORY|nr:DUF4040 family protein [Corynebacterium occultum]QGU06261.1 Na(+)/H(+) antiporter subunit A [Corynebacterium occultum]